MTSYLGRLVKNAAADYRAEIAAWLAALAAIPEQELKRRGAMEVVRASDR